MRSALLAADLGSSATFDGSVSDEVPKLIAEARIFGPEPVARFVLNRCGARTIVAREAQLLVDRDPPVLASTIGQCVAFATPPAAVGCQRDQADGPAAREIAALVAAIREVIEPSSNKS